jgi:hypothetical protein
MAFKDAAARAAGGQGGGETVYGEEQDETAVRAARGNGGPGAQVAEGDSPRMGQGKEGKS